MLLCLIVGKGSRTRCSVLLPALLTSSRPRLCLMQLASKQIWKDNTQWKGWIMCAQQTVPDSFLALVSLPAEVLATAAKALPDGIMRQMLVYAKEGTNAVPGTTLEVLEQLQPSHDAQKE